MSYNTLKVWLTETLRASVKKKFNIIIFGDCSCFYKEEEKCWYFSRFIEKADGKDKKKKILFYPYKAGVL